MEPLQIVTFGGLRATLGQVPGPRFETRKADALLVYLACNRRALKREVLADFLWDERSQAQSLSNLRVVLASLRKHLEPYLAITRESVAIHPEALIWTDAVEFEERLNASHAKGEIPTQPDAKEIKRAVDLYQGEFLQGFFLRESRGFEAWLVQERERLHRLAAAALHELVGSDLQSGAYPTGITHAARLLALDPFDELAHRQMMQLLAHSGRRSEALAQFESCQKILWEEFGIEPEAQTQALHERIRSGEIFRDPALQGQGIRLAGKPRLRHNLPAQLTSFIGRTQEKTDIARLFVSAHLVTLAGPGGIGKTRLALQAAAEHIEAFPGGAWLVELAALADPGLAPQAIIAALGMQADASRSPVAVLIDFFRDQTALLILDNCEHLVEACAQLSEALLRACPDLRILATSRESLGIAGESLYRVPPLPVPTHESPTPADVLQSDAGRLFVERAGSALPGFMATPGNAAAIARVCRRLDGIPLAIELAAARVNLLMVEEIAARLDERFRLLSRGGRTALPKHQTLRGLIDWSWDLLSELEQQLLRRLSVFAGDWTLEAAEAVCSDRMTDSNILDLLASLVDKSMVDAYRQQGGPARYLLLETIRQYGREKLLEAGEEAAYRTRHRDWFLELAERAGPELRGRGQPAWLNRLESEHDNLRAALEWSRGQKEALPMLRLAGALTHFWMVSGHFEEGCRWLKEALALAGEAGASPGESALERSPWRAKALLGLGSLLVDRREQFVTAGILLEEAVSIFREIEEPSGLASGLYWLADKAWTESNVASAQSLYEESLAYAQAAGVRWVVGKCLDSLAGFADIEGDHLKARKLKEEAVVVMREVGDQKELAAPVMWLAYRIWGEGDTDKARGLIEEILPELRGTGARKEIVYLQNMLTIWTAVQGDFEKGRTYLEETLTISQELKSKYLLAWTLFISGIVDYLEGALEPARAHIEQSNQLFRELDYSYDISWNLEYLGQVYARLGDHTKAIALLEESLAFEFGGTESKANKLLPLGDALRAQGDIERAADCYRQSMMLQAEIKAVVNIPPRLEALAKLAAIQGQPERSARLFGAAQAGRERFGTPLPPVERPEYESSLAVVRSGLGEECFAAAWLAGRAMTLEGATAYALEAGGGQNHEEGTGA